MRKGEEAYGSLDLLGGLLLLGDGLASASGLLRLGGTGLLGGASLLSLACGLARCHRCLSRETRVWEDGYGGWTRENTTSSTIAERR